MALALAFFFVTALSVSAATCTKISSDIGRGSSSASVLSLQNFLKESGYLSATPNGYFGPATLAATKSFQSTKGISATGFVGPLTRVAIEAASCGSTDKPKTDTGSNTSAGSASGVSFTSNLSGVTLRLGDTYKASWSAPKNADLMLVIEDEQGVNKGSLSGYLGAAQSYEWEIGFVNVSGQSSPSALVPGRYRLRLQGRMDGKMQSDAVTSYFLVEAPSLSISHMYPTTILADGKTPGIFYGTGFTAGVTAYLDDSWDKALKLTYASPDAKLMVYTVPKGIPTGRYRIVLRNNYGSSYEGGMIQITN